MSTMIQQREATVEDLCNVKDKAEIVNGRIVHMPPTGDDPGYAGDRVFISLDNYAERTGSGRAVSDNKGFIVNLPNRKSFSPDAAFLTAKRAGMRFIEGAPLFAVEVRSEGDYGNAAEQRMAEKRHDYFAAGTLVVWDVDLLSEDVVKVYRASDPDNPVIYRRGEIAEAEPAVPGWTMPVDKLFPPPEE
jgi:Uma2 family endonuclease